VERQAAVGRQRRCRRHSISGARRGTLDRIRDSRNRHEYTGNTARFAAGHPEAADHGYRAVHEMTVAAKAIIAAFYGNGPRLSYWNSCSTGGRQGLMEAQRSRPTTTGSSPARPSTSARSADLGVDRAGGHKDDASYFRAKAPAIIARRSRGDARDGVTDGLIRTRAAVRSRASRAAAGTRRRA
jgi:hypothetical protein